MPVIIMMVAGIINDMDMCIRLLLTMFTKLKPITEPTRKAIQRKTQKITIGQFLSAMLIPISVAGPVKCVVRLIDVKLVAAF